MLEELKNIFFKNMPKAYAMHKFIEDSEGNPCDYIFLDVNKRFEEYTGLKTEDIINKRVTQILPDIKGKGFDWIKTYAEVAYNGKEIELEEYSEPLDKWYKVYAYSSLKGYFVTLFDEITEKKKLELRMIEMDQIIQRQQILIDVYNREETDETEFLDYILHRAINMTDSRYGYIYLYDEEKEEFTLNTWTDTVMPDCRIIDPDTLYKLEKTGIWGEVVRQRRSIIVNDFEAENPLKKGYPDGHVKLTSFMSIPLLINGIIVAVVGLANKEKGYTELDVNQLILLMQSSWLIKESKQQRLVFEEERLKNKNILDRIPALVCELSEDTTITYANDSFKRYFGYEEGMKFTKIIPEDKREDHTNNLKKIESGQSGSVYVYPMFLKGKTRWLQWQDISLANTGGSAVYYTIGVDITDRIEIENIREQEFSRLRAVFEKYNAAMLFVDPVTDIIFDLNDAAVKFYGFDKEELIGMSLKEIRIDDPDSLYKYGNYYTYAHRLKNGEIRIVEMDSSLIEYMDKRVLFCVVFDVTERERALEEIKYLAYHDYLTGAYNRRFFEEEFERLRIEDQHTLAVILGDINGLKMINDSLGHIIGDHLIKEANRQIKEEMKQGNILARIGGDEFGIILKDASVKEVELFTNLLEAKLEHFIDIGESEKHKVYLSVSFGYGVQKKEGEGIDELLKEAEAHSYRRKYYNSRSMRSQMLKAMMGTLFQKSEREQRHSERVGRYAKALAKALQWSPQRVNRLSVAATLHDIGKIGISEAILNKNTRLDKDEWETMKQHPLKSFNILSDTEEYYDIAGIVKYHHEFYDGNGYPEGLKGDLIPEESRVIAVADAYDAMTRRRPYRKEISSEEAALELIRCSGTQFDPDYVKVFINKVLKHSGGNG